MRNFHDPVIPSSLDAASFPEEDCRINVSVQVLSMMTVPETYGIAYGMYSAHGKVEASKSTPHVVTDTRSYAYKALEAEAAV